MPYTLAKFFFWGLLMALAGGVVGWMLRSLKARVQLTRARSSPVDAVEVERLRGRLANLEPVVAERDRLRMELADVRGSSAGALGFSSTVEAPIIPPDDLDSLGTVQGIEAIESVERPEVEERVETPVAEVDLDAAAGVLGEKITLDDLTVVDGIGPKIAQLCNGIGVTTWAQLAGTDVDTLQAMLDAAGSRFQMHRPESWPQQASLLATGQWAEFAAFTETPADGI